MDKFEVLILNRRDGIIAAEFVDVPSTIAFLTRLGRSALSYSVMTRRGKKAVFIERMINLVDLSKELTEFMVKTASSQ